MRCEGSSLLIENDAPQIQIPHFPRVDQPGAPPPPTPVFLFIFLFVFE